MPGPPTKLRNESLGFIHVVFLLRAQVNNAFLNTAGAMDAVRQINSCCFETAFGRKSSTFWKWQWLRKIALESKRLIHTWWIWCQNTFNRIFYAIQQKSMVFNQESRWNNGWESLHSFWATLYSSMLHCVICIMGGILWILWIYQKLLGVIHYLAYMHSSLQQTV